MTDAIAAKVAATTGEKVAQEGGKELGKQLPGVQSEFQQLLVDRLNQQEARHAQVMQLFGLQPEDQIPIRSIPADGLTIDPQRLSPVHDIRTSGKMMDLLTDVNRSALQLDNIVGLATSGRRFTPTELLAMQAGVYQIVQEVELTSKIFESLNNAQRQLINTNIA